MNNFGFYDLYSTYQKDFIPHKLEVNGKVRPKSQDPLEKSKLSSSIEKPSQIHLETLTPFKKDVHVPFDLYFRLKDCVQTNPYDKISYDDDDVNTNEINFKMKLEKRRTRPRVYLVPQICLDDIPEDIMYSENGIAENIYTTDWEKACKTVWPNYHKNRKHFEKVESTVDMEKLMRSMRYKGFHHLTSAPLLDPEVEKYASEWNNFQPIAFVDTNKLFWEKNKDKGLCSVCEPKLKSKFEIEEQENLEKLIKEDKLRHVYTVNLPGYGGYIPKLPVGINMKKKLFKAYEPWVTTNMIAQNEFLSN